VMECLRKLLLTGFVVFFYEGSGLQILFGLSISIVFFGLYAFLHPYLMPSNNTFVVFVHFNISFTLLLTLLIRMNETFTQDQSKKFQVNELSISYALLISNASVLLVGVIYILRDIVFKNEADYRIFESKIIKWMIYDTECHENYPMEYSMKQLSAIKTQLRKFDKNKKIFTFLECIRVYLTVSKILVT